MGGPVLQVTFDRLPANAALLAFGWNRLSPPVSLASLGLPNCSAPVYPDAVVFLAGTAGKAQCTLSIPYAPSLVGVRFHHQAIVLDPGAGNPLGAVLSDAAEAVVGGGTRVNPSCDGMEPAPAAAFAARAPVGVSPPGAGLSG